MQLMKDMGYNVIRLGTPQPQKHFFEELTLLDKMKGLFGQQLSPQKITSTAHGTTK